ncbi:hypothetical protein C8F01DRAFT_1283448, partial [Mycena amicta]
MDDAPACPGTKVENLWFPDGTLVICAAQKLFKVSKFILAARSSVFRPPCHPKLGVMYDGCSMPTVTEKGEDVEAFLKAIFDSSYFEPPPTPVVVSSLVGILRLAHKYDVQYLFRRALKHLEVFFPSCGVLPEDMAPRTYHKFTAHELP